jgi:excisionase family DNA binding protein
MEKLMTVNEVADYLKIKPEIVRRKVRNHEIKAYKVGKAWRFSVAEVKKFLENCLR